MEDHANAEGINMTQDEIIRFAIQCHLVTTGNRDGLYMDALTEFAKLVAAKEREATIKIIKETPFSNWFQADVIEAIRARGDA
jgi:hypothetical protein